MGAREYVLLALVILVPLAIAVTVTLWSLEQVRYRPKRWRRPAVKEEAASGRTVDDNTWGAAEKGSHDAESG